MTNTNFNEKPIKPIITCIYCEIDTVGNHAGNCPAKDVNTTTNIISVNKETKHKLRLIRWSNDGYPPIDLRNEFKAVLDLIKEYKILERQLKPQEGEWISVKDKLPTSGQQIIVFGKYGTLICSSDSPIYQEAEITCWQPLPVPPKG